MTKCKHCDNPATYIMVSQGGDLHLCHEHEPEEIVQFREQLEATPGGTEKIGEAIKRALDNYVVRKKEEGHSGGADSVPLLRETVRR